MQQRSNNAGRLCMLAEQREQCVCAFCIKKATYSYKSLLLSLHYVYIANFYCT